MFRFKIIIGVIWVFGALACAYTTSAAPNPQVFMSADVEGRQRSDRFDCHDSIYIHGVIVPTLQRGNVDGKAVKREAYAVWFRPDGREQDRASHAVEGADARFWFWLRLTPSFGGKLLKSIDPSYGMGEFIGFWRVDLYLDEKVIATKVFFVAC